MVPEFIDAIELARIREVLAYDILDTAAEPCFDRLVAMTAEACDAPIALVTLLDDERQWFKARVGTTLRQTPRCVSFCTHALRTPNEMMVVADAANDERFRESPLVTSGPRARFYAGVPLVLAGGQAMGTLCVLDVVPRELTLRQRASLQALARVVVRFLERRRGVVWN